MGLLWFVCPDNYTLRRILSDLECLHEGIASPADESVIVQYVYTISSWQLMTHNFVKRLERYDMSITHIERALSR